MGSSSEVMTAYQTAMAAREWSGLSYAMQLRAMEYGDSSANILKTAFPELKVKYFHFGMHSINPPLGWSLSEVSRRCIDDLLNRDSYADQEIQRLDAILNEH